MTQLLARVRPSLMAVIPHIMDPRTSICSFGSPEQGLMAVAMIQMARSYGLPVYVIVGLTDAKVPDAQAASKRQPRCCWAYWRARHVRPLWNMRNRYAGSLLWLFLDHEIMNYVKRINRGFEWTGKLWPSMSFNA
jgi:trimethylamine--corrinoid protein Co-methyltransferase